MSTRLSKDGSRGGGGRVGGNAGGKNVGEFRNPAFSLSSDLSNSSSFNRLSSSSSSPCSFSSSNSENKNKSKSKRGDISNKKNSNNARNGFANSNNILNKIYSSSSFSSSCSSASSFYSSFPSHVEVLIVGAGPSGLALAIDLARRGIDFIILDMNVSHVTQSRALVVHARTLEIFDDFGVIEDALNAGCKARGVKVYLNNETTREIILRGLSSHTTYPYALIIEQCETERILLKKLHSLGHDVLRPVAVWKIEGVDNDIDEFNKEVLKYVQSNQMTKADGKKTEETDFKGNNNFKKKRFSNHNEVEEGGKQPARQTSIILPRRMSKSSNKSIDEKKNSRPSFFPSFSSSSFLSKKSNDGRDEGGVGESPSAKGKATNNSREDMSDDDDPNVNNNNMRNKSFGKNSGGGRPDSPNFVEGEGDEKVAEFVIKGGTRGGGGKADTEEDENENKKKKNKKYSSSALPLNDESSSEEEEDEKKRKKWRLANRGGRKMNSNDDYNTEDTDDSYEECNETEEQNNININNAHRRSDYGGGVGVDFDTKKNGGETGGRRSKFSAHNNHKFNSNDKIQEEEEDEDTDENNEKEEEEEEEEDEEDSEYKVTVHIKELNDEGLPIEDGSFHHKIRAKYVVGCDGARSLVRKASYIRYEGKTYTTKFTVCDVRVDWNIAYEFDKLQIIINEEGLLIIMPLVEDRWRVVFSGSGFSMGYSKTGGGGGGASSVYSCCYSNNDSDNNGGGGGGGGGRNGENMYGRNVSTEQATLLAPPSEHDVAQLIDNAIPGSRLIELLWGSSYMVNSRVARSLMKGRAFLVGDSAHIHPPVFGQGMNTGIQDAYNLGWKLAAVLKGDSNVELLNSYNLERKQIAEEIVNMTSSAFEKILSDGKASAFSRYCLSSVLRVISTVDMFQKGLARKVAMLDHKYKQSDFISKGGLSYGGIQPGERAPDALVKCIPLEGSDVLRECPRYMYDYIRGAHHSLLLCLNLLPPGVKKKNFFGCQTLQPTPRWSLSSFERLARTGRLLSEAFGVCETCIWGGLSVVWVICCKSNLNNNICDSNTTNNNTANGSYTQYFNSNYLVNSYNKYYKKLMSNYIMKDEDNRRLTNGKNNSNEKTQANKLPYYELVPFNIPNKLAHYIRNTNIPGKLKVVYDFAEEVSEKYGLQLSPPNDELGSRDNSGAYVLIRPDKHVSHCGYANDLNNISSMIDYGLKYFKNISV